MRRGAVSGGRVALAGCLLASVLAAGLVASPATAGLEFSDVHGHMTLGFSHLFVSDTTNTPGGSVSFGAGADIPIHHRLRAGIDVGYHLLGSQTLDQGSLSSGIDYSLFEAIAFLHWSPLDHGPDLVISVGPGLFHTKAELAASSVGLAFTPYAVNETRVGGALFVTSLRRKPTPVRPGFVVGVRVIPLEGVTWTVVSAGIALSY
jgi:hypothetical protein